MMDIYEFTRTVKAMFKVKGLIQRQLALKRVCQITEHRMTEKRKVLESNDREGLALKEFTTQLKAKRMTPEAFFRICDVSYSKSVPVDNFKQQVELQGLRLTRSQMDRLILLLDENMTGAIGLEEYQGALEVYGLAGEKHFVSQGRQSKPYASMQNKALEVLTDMMKIKDMSSDDLFNVIDLDGSGWISPEELKETLLKVEPSLLIKEAKGIETYFDQFDMNRNGRIERDEFNAMFARITRIVDKKKEKDIAAQDEFDMNLETGDQSVFTAAFDKAKAVIGGKEDPIVPIIKEMEATGLSLKAFHTLCADFQQNVDKMQNSQFLLLL